MSAVVEWWVQSVAWFFEPERLTAIAALLGALAALAWPLVLLTALFYFGRDLRGLLPRLRRWKLFGQKLELADEINKVQQAVAASAR